MVYGLGRNKSTLRARVPKLKVQSAAISIAIPPNRFLFGSVERKNRVKAINQHPAATMPGIIRLWGPRTAGEGNGRFAGKACVVACEPSRLCDVSALPDVIAAAPRTVSPVRDWTAVAFPGRVFDWYFPVRFLAFGIVLTQLPAGV
jgi:hypothetical protein